MEISNILRLIMILAGIVLFGGVIVSLAKKRMTDTICLMWGVISFLIILGGIFLRPTQVNKYMSTAGIVLVILIIFCVAIGLYFLSVQISILTRKNQELAMHVSLINQENEQLIKRIQALEDAQNGD